MSKFIGIRHEDKYLMERRTPLTPKHIERLIQHHKLDFIVQTSERRIFSDNEYIKAGAKIAKDLKKCDIILGIKEIPENFFEPEKTYVFFSHVIKGQPYNMPMLRKMKELKCNLIDYEKIIDEQGKRLIFFGRYAGLAGMINSLWACGLRLKELGTDNKLIRIKQSHLYSSLKEAKDIISSIGQRISEDGLTEGLKPFVVGFTGYGNVSNGAQEILGLLPVKEISPEKLLSLKNRHNLPNNIIYKVVFSEEDIYEHKEGKDFDLHDLYANPQNYKSKFEQYVPHMSILMNCMYWDNRYPRIVTKEYLKKLFSKGQPKLTVIGDITCDPDGSIECTHDGTHIEDPIFVYNPGTDTYKMGFKGEGILDMAVSILPSELPRDASYSFGDMLFNFIKPIANADYNMTFEDIDLPRAIKKGMILHNGEFTPEYKYLESFVSAKLPEGKKI
ncbi:MAG: bifunctional lysine ketoglutarate reductase /saccharopine dehydrogenase family protein [Bacteroidales bacterium]|jgi:alpha-aminoadipic semialdehyde synthase|nr:bifunctional lysine ketoglutarate reductase /saccharopine dehydrogenase family protein [Bacteroidales bacterium]MDD4214399.1 bifunctional lysine ketoglutarate reductase /saccharopine dehydrogenase family protein [Bacteroidales bacterium]